MTCSKPDNADHHYAPINFKYPGKGGLQRANQAQRKYGPWSGCNGHTGKYLILYQPIILNFLLNIHL